MIPLEAEIELKRPWPFSRSSDRRDQCEASEDYGAYRAGFGQTPVVL